MKRRGNYREREGRNEKNKAGVHCTGRLGEMNGMKNMGGGRKRRKQKGSIWTC